ncbi:TRAP transporter substrate-binding protein [Paracidovorax anthurii]|uniref:TRAP-type C4-dicarboxylate transport system substrate-binding protein n=1 Tax=Paracidovorax anthurii TaxID=78229 RepID=A0A328ZPK1_9BURK|nr:TRAP-type C4-dicarboxylate transport system substrate-binding protein [Paracidovorax anthurii]
MSTYRRFLHCPVRLAFTRHLAACLAVAWALLPAGAATVPERATPGPGAAAAADAGRGPQKGASVPAASYRLRIVGNLGGLSQYSQREAPFWTQELSRLSGGRFTASIVPFDRAGVPGIEMLRLVELGVVPLGTVLVSSLTAQYPQYTAPDLPGLNPTLADLRASVEAFRPYLQAALRERHHFELLAVYVYPAQVLFCQKPLSGLADLAGRRVRVSSAAQADFMAALGAVPVYTGFGQIVASLQAGDSECTVTGTMTGNTLGLHRLTRYLYPLPITWGLSFFGANDEAWGAMPADLRALLLREMPRLEEAIWRDAEAETAEGVACNSGQPACQRGEKGAMVVVPVSAADDARRQRLLREAVLPNWLRRCSDGCADAWSKTIGRARGIPVPGRP